MITNLAYMLHRTYVHVRGMQRIKQIAVASSVFCLAASMSASAAGSITGAGATFPAQIYKR